MGYFWSKVQGLLDPHTHPGSALLKNIFAKRTAGWFGAKPGFVWGDLFIFGCSKNPLIEIFFRFLEQILESQSVWLSSIGDEGGCLAFCLTKKWVGSSLGCPPLQPATPKTLLSPKSIKNTKPKGNHSRKGSKKPFKTLKEPNSKNPPFPPHFHFLSQHLQKASLQRALRRFLGTIFGSLVAMGSVLLVGPEAAVWGSAGRLGERFGGRNRRKSGKNGKIISGDLRFWMFDVSFSSCFVMFSVLVLVSQIICLSQLW